MKQSKNNVNNKEKNVKKTKCKKNIIRRVKEKVYNSPVSTLRSTEDKEDNAGIWKVHLITEKNTCEWWLMELKKMEKIVLSGQNHG